MKDKRSLIIIIAILFSVFAMYFLIYKYAILKHKHNPKHIIELNENKERL